MNKTTIHSSPLLPLISAIAAITLCIGEVTGTIRLNTNAGQLVSIFQAFVYGTFTILFIAFSYVFMLIRRGSKHQNS